MMNFFRRFREGTRRLLLWSQKYTKTDMLYLAKGGFWVWGGQGISLIAGLGLAVAFANLVPPKVYGEYKFILAAGGIIGAFSLTGLGTALTRSVAQGHAGELKKSFYASLKYSIPLFLISFAVAGYYYLQGNTTLALGMLAVGIFQPLRQAGGLFAAYLNGTKDFQGRGIYMASQELVVVVALVLALLFLPAYSVYFVWIFFIFQVFLSLLFFWRIHSVENGPEKSPSDSKKTVSYAKHLSVMNGIVKVGANIDKILVFHFLGAVDLALYAFALLPAQKTQSFLESLNFLLLPKFSTRNIDELKRSITRKALVFLLVLAIATAILILIIPPLFRTVIPQYTSSIIYAQIFSLSLLTLPSILYVQALTAHEKKKELYVVRLAANIVKLILLLVLVPVFGLWGAIFAFLGFFLIRFLVATSCFYFIKH